MKRDNLFYYVRHIPSDLTHHYSVQRICFSLKTKSDSTAVRFSKSITQRLDDYWLSLRMSNIDIPGLHLIRNNLQATTNSSCIKLSEALEVYLKLKGVN